ncbi:MFS transporter [Streptomyces hygroscopicus]|uniref:MFS transporter n=1 Tax=Streptomyces hygroscopicus TaxID=1912 RepID=UPI00223EE35A|nr:MFS transporter [Streptomyces hygroscopicus]
MELTAIDEAPMSRFHRKLALACSGGPLLDGYLLSIIGIALVGISDSLRLGSAATAMIGVAALVGMFFGGLIIGPVTDMVGRRVMYTIDLAVLLVASVACAFVTSAGQLIVLRLIIGFAIGADYPIATSLLTEWLPRRQRARMMGVLIVAWYVGATAAYFVGYLLAENTGPGAWRWMLASAAVVSVGVIALRHGTPESPRWLVAKGRPEEASALIERVLRVRVTPGDLTAAHASRARRGSVTELFRGLYLRRTAFCALFYTCAVIPLWALYIFGPKILSTFGLGSGNLSNLGSVLITLVFLLGTLPAMRWLESVGRRKMITWSFAAMVPPLLVLALWPSAPVAIVILCFCLYGLFSGAPNILEWAYPNELFPTSIRASAVGMAVALSRFGAAAGTYLVPVSLAHLGTGATMGIGAAITAAGWLVCLAWAEETSNRPLEEVGRTGTGPDTFSQTGTEAPSAAGASRSDE